MTENTDWIAAYDQSIADLDDAVREVKRDRCGFLFFFVRETDDGDEVVSLGMLARPHRDLLARAMAHRLLTRVGEEATAPRPRREEES